MLAIGYGEECPFCEVIMTKDIKIFDFYEGQGIPKGKKSLAFSIFWLANNRTMTDLEIDKIVKKIVGFLSDKLDAKIRT